MSCDHGNILNYENKSGWISPSGEFYPLIDNTHIDEAEIINEEILHNNYKGINCELFLEEKHWLKLSKGNFYFKPDLNKIDFLKSFHYSLIGITSDEINTIVNFMYKYSLKYVMINFVQYTKNELLEEKEIINRMGL